MDTLRNQVTATFGSVDVKLRATFGVIREIETQFGKSTLGVLSDFDKGEVTLENLRFILMCGAKGAGASISAERAEELIMEVGVAMTVAQIVPLLLVAYTGGPIQKDESKKKSEV